MEEPLSLVFRKRDEVLGSELAEYAVPACAGRAVSHELYRRRDEHEHQLKACNDPPKLASFNRNRLAYGDVGKACTIMEGSDGDECELAALPWSPQLERLVKLLNEATGCAFNYVLVEYYEAVAPLLSGVWALRQKQRPIATISLPRSYVIAAAASPPKVSVFFYGRNSAEDGWIKEPTTTTTASLSNMQPSASGNGADHLPHPNRVITSL